MSGIKGLSGSGNKPLRTSEFVKGCRTSALAPRLLRARLGRCRTSLRGGNCGRVTLGVFADVVYGDLTVCPWLMVGFLVAVWPLDDVRWVI
jgi:hypothetical protein